MAGFSIPDWDSMFIPDGSLLESFLRATLVYILVLFLFRIALKRQRGSVGLGDLMLLLLMSEIVSQGMIGEYYSLPNAAVGLTTFVGWCYVTDWLCYRYKWADRLLQSSPLQLLRDGQPLHDNMRQEHINEEDLLSKIRERGHDDFSGLRAVFIEPDGKVSVIPRNQQCGPHDRDSETNEIADHPAPPDLEATAHRFLEAAHRLQEVAVWHEEQAAEHKQLASSAKQTLRQYGIQPRALQRTPRSSGQSNRARPTS